MQHSQSLPYASSLCGACYEVCPVKINIPEILIHLRRELVNNGSAPLSERLAMRVAAFSFAGGDRLALAQKLGRIGQRPFEHDGMLHKLPGVLSGWTSARDLQAIPKESFRDWWQQRKAKEPA